MRSPVKFNGVSGRGTRKLPSVRVPREGAGKMSILISCRIEKAKETGNGYKSQ